MMDDGRRRGPGLRSGGDEVCLVRSLLSFIGCLLEKVSKVAWLLRDKSFCRENEAQGMESPITEVFWTWSD
jgi:hypothetical protein